MYQGGDGALQASCGGFDSRLVHHKKENFITLIASFIDRRN